MQCDYFDAGRCRSCTLMGQPYSSQLRDRQLRATGALSGHLDLRWLPPIESAESHYRNKAKLVVGGRATNPTLGILDDRGRGVDLRRCGLYEPGLAATFDPIHRYLSELGLPPYDVPARRGELKYVIVTHSPDGEHLVRFVVRSPGSVDRLRDSLPRLRELLPSARVVTANIHPEHKAVLEGDTEIVLTEASLLPMRIGAVTLFLGPRSFFQTNTRVAAQMYAQAAQWAAADPAVIWDLYCGVGGFALHLAGSGRTVLGVESSQEAITAAQRSAELLPESGSGTVSFISGDATEGIAGPAPDLVVVNPPRRGIGPDLAAWLNDSPASTVIYSSCNLDSLARDLAAMPALRATQARIADMFPQTNHVETMVLLERR